MVQCKNTWVGMRKFRFCTPPGHLHHEFPASQFLAHNVDTQPLFCLRSQVKHKGDHGWEGALGAVTCECTGVEVMGI